MMNHPILNHYYCSRFLHLLPVFLLFLLFVLYFSF
eukprot:UN13045